MGVLSPASKRRPHPHRETVNAPHRKRQATVFITIVNEAMATLNGSFKTIHSEIWPTTTARAGSGPDDPARYRILEELIPISAPAEIRSPTDWLKQLSPAIMDDGAQYLSLVDERKGEIGSAYRR
ncbi:hypothetical protein [Methylocapsa palsarum]|nr:hypothetical protein [Methylocapsa palsarum]